MNAVPSAATLLLHAYDELAAERREDWSRIAVELQGVGALEHIAVVDVRSLVALVLNDQPLIDGQILRARARSLQLLAAALPAVGMALHDPPGVVLALRAIADIVNAPRL